MVFEITSWESEGPNAIGMGKVYSPTSIVRTPEPKELQSQSIKKEKTCSICTYAVYTAALLPFC